MASHISPSNAWKVFPAPGLTPRTPRSVASRKFHLGAESSDEDDFEEHEEELVPLRRDESDHASDLEDGFGSPAAQPAGPVSAEDKRAMVLLCVLYLIQGIPLGLASGSMPFILQDRLSYSQLAWFSLSSYPYSLKLLWSPIVDSVFISSIGRRKSWVIPIQIISASLMLYISLEIQRLMDAPEHHVIHLTNVFTGLVFFAATQDIALDGWALTLLSPENLSYASTCQTIGMNSGYFTSYTVFLALNSEHIVARLGVPRLTLAAYLKFWCFVVYAVSVLLMFVKEREVQKQDARLNIWDVYEQIWALCKMEHIQSLMILFLFGKIGFAANDAATSLKMVEKGLLREDLAIAVLLNFPFQIIAGWFVGAWCRGDYPLRPWVYAFWPRIAFAFTALLFVYYFPTPPFTAGLFTLLVVHTILTSLTSTVQFVASNAFFTRISDPLIGGTYMTMLNTVSNIGTQWPKWFVLKSIDMFTIKTCQASEPSDMTASVARAAANCVVERDGYYIVSTICMAFGTLFLIFYSIPTARRMQALPSSAWRVS